MCVSSTLPAVVFMYELSPMTVRTIETRRPLLTFITSACAIVGGILSTFGILDKIVLWALEVAGTGGGSGGGGGGMPMYSRKAAGLASGFSPGTAQ